MTDSESTEATAYHAQVTGAINSLRDTAKWISGGVAVAAGGVLAGSALNGLGSVQPIWRLALAIAGAFIGLVALGLVLWRAIDVLAPRRLSLTSLSDPRVVPGTTAREIETDLAMMFPSDVGGQHGRISSFAALRAAMQQITVRLHGPSGADKDAARAEAQKINASLEFLLPAATFEELRLRFLAVRRAVFLVVQLSHSHSVYMRGLPTRQKMKVC
jgi:hypothetical protein